MDSYRFSSIGSKIKSFTSCVGGVCAALIITGFNLWCLANNKRPY